MCGIFGVVHKDRTFEFTGPRLHSACDSIKHRGPDDAGEYRAPGVFLGNRRLAILDLSPRGHMPMRSHDGRYWITYNGEIFNFGELRRMLEGRGWDFQSDSDTEVLLALYCDRGRDMLPLLNGMFSFAIWDSVEQCLFAARDRLGVKPFYYAWHRDACYFASEQKALFAAGVPLRLDSSKWEELLCFRFVAGEDTPFLGVKRLLPGHELTIRNGDVRTRPWWDLVQRAIERRESPPADSDEWFRETFYDSVNLRRISDVPVGVLLSGGLDSSSVAAVLAAQAGTGVASFTVRFDDPLFDEGEYAKLVAVRWSLNYHELSVPTDKLLDQLTRASWFNDEPLAHGSDLHLHAIATYAKSAVTVLLSGEGADETLGGYVRYQPLRWRRSLKLLHHLASPTTTQWLAEGRLRKLTRFLNLHSLDDFVMLNSCNVLPSELIDLGISATGQFHYRQLLLDRSRELYGDDLMRRAMYVDQLSFMSSLLDRNDRMTMGASIECRVPFLDYRLVETLGGMPSSDLLKGFKTKQLLRSTMNPSLPKAVRSHRKWGFGVPWIRYMREVPALVELIRSVPGAAIFQDSPMDAAKVRIVIDQFMSGDDHYSEIVRQLLMIRVWSDAYVDKFDGAGESAPLPVAVH